MTVEEHDVIQKALLLQAAKSRLGISCEQMAERSEELGVPVSLKTIRKAMNPTISEGNISKSTIRKLAIVLDVDLFEEANNAAATRQINEYQKRIETLEALVAVKDDQIQHRTKEIGEYDAQVASMRATVQEYQRAVARKEKYLRLSVITLVIVFIIAVALLATDMLTPSLGFFRRFVK